MSEQKRRTGSGGFTVAGRFSRRGGYSPTGGPVTKLPRVPLGPAPGSYEKPPSPSSDETKQGEPGEN